MWSMVVTCHLSNPMTLVRFESLLLLKPWQSVMSSCRMFASVWNKPSSLLSCSMITFNAKSLLLWVTGCGYACIIVLMTLWELLHHANFVSGTLGTKKLWI